MAQQFAWPKAQTGAVSITFDDGMRSQLEAGVPMLRPHGLRATFYVHIGIGADPAKRLEPWKAVADEGHEIGNHSVTHPCSINLPFIQEQGRHGVEGMTLADMEWEITEANRLLAQQIPQQTGCSFAYPCYQDYIGRGQTRASYVPLVAKHCVAGHGRGGMANDPRYLDPAYVTSFECENMTGATLIGLVERAAASGRWAVLTFHGIQEGGLSIGERDFAELCSHLEMHRERIWCAPVVDIPRWVVGSGR